MRANTKAKWIVGMTGTIFSAFIISQLDQSIQDDTAANVNGFATKITDSMSDREKELVQLDWSDFSLQVNNRVEKSSTDRTSRKTR